MNRRRAHLILLAALVAATGCDGSGSFLPGALFGGVDAPFQPPGFSGPHAVGKTSFHWTDASRAETLTARSDDQRELMVHLFYPADAAGPPAVPVIRDRELATLTDRQVVPGSSLRRSNYDGVAWPISESPLIAAAPALLPVIVFSHGGGGAIERSLFLIGELASNGYVVAAVNHSYHADFVEFPDGQLALDQGFGLDGDGVISPAEAALLADAQVLWATDQLFVVDQLVALDQQPGGAFENRLDLARLATTGYSFGGAAAFEAASRDARITAVVNFDGTIWPSGDPGIAVPLLWAQSGSGAQLEVFDRVTADGYAALFDGGVTHGVFDDLSLFWRWDFPGLHPFGALDSLAALRASALLVRQFLAKYQDGAAAPVLDDPAQAPPGTRVVRFQ